MRFGKFSLLVLIASATLISWRTSDNDVEFGDRTTGTNKTIKANNGTASPPFMRFNSTKGAWEFTNDGTNLFDVGSGSGGGGGGVNFLVNGGYESGVTDWTASGGNFEVTTTAGEVGRQGQSGQFNASATNQTLKSGLTSVPNLLEGKACILRVNYRYDTGVGGALDNDYKVYVEDSTPVANEYFLAQNLTLTQVGVWKQAVFSFVCPTNESLRFVIESNAATAEEITLDDLTVGSDDRRGVQGDQAELIASAHYPGAAGCSWDRTNTAYGQTTSDDTDCPSIVPDVGTITPTITTGDFPKITIPNLPPGKYVVTASFGMTNSTSAQVSNASLTDVANCASGFEGQLSFTPGTTAGASETATTVKATFEYATTATRTFEICTAASAGSVTINNGSANRQVNFFVERFPNQSPRDTVTLETQGLAWSGRHQSDCSWQRLSASYGDFAVDATCTLSDLVNYNFGTVTSRLSGSDKLPGIVLTPRRTGLYKVCANLHANNTATGTVSLRLFETIVHDESSSLGTPTADTYDQLTLCGLIDFPNLAAKTVSIEGKASANSAEIKPGPNLNQTITWIVYPLTQQFPQAIALTPPTSQIKVDTPSGRGTGSDTAIRHFTNTVINQGGNCISFASDPTLGARFTIGCSGVYCVSYGDLSSTANVAFGASVNSTQRATAIYSINAADRLFNSTTSATGYAVVGGACRKLSVGDIVRPHTDPATAITCTGAFCEFTITQTSF